MSRTEIPELRARVAALLQTTYPDFLPDFNDCIRLRTRLPPPPRGRDCPVRCLR